MKTSKLMLNSARLGTALLVLSGCSSTPNNPSAATPAPPPPPPAAPELIAAGFEVETATAAASVESIDAATRKIVLKRADGTTSTYKAGPEVVNFSQIKAGDIVLATVTDDCAFFLVKGGVLPGTTATSVVARAPKGSAPGGTLINTFDTNARVLDVNLETRRVILEYAPGQAKSVKVGPRVDLTNIHPGDDVLVRGSEAMAIAVMKP